MTILNFLHREYIVGLFDAPDNLFYLDPPYLTKGKYYSSGNFVEDAFVKIAGLLKDIKGLNDCDEVREGFKDFYFLEVETLWVFSFAKKAFRKEVLIHNHYREKSENSC